MKKKTIVIISIIISMIIVSVVCYVFFSQWNIHGYSRYLNSDNRNNEKIVLEGTIDNKKVYTYKNELKVISFSSKEETLSKYLTHTWMNKEYILDKFYKEKTTSKYIKYIDENKFLTAYETDNYIIITHNEQFSVVDKLINKLN